MLRALTREKLLRVCLFCFLRGLRPLFSTKQPIWLASVLVPTVCLFAAAAPAMAQQYSAPASPGSAVLDVAASASSVPAQINQLRINSNLPTLAADPLLQRAAQLHAVDMITYGNWSHIGTDGSRVKDRVARSGYVVDGWTSENWVSARDDADALKWWMNSPVHRANMLSVHWREFGVGSIVDPSSGRTIYVTVFATGKHGNNVAKANPVAVVSLPVALPAPASNAATTSTAIVDTATTDRATIRAGDTLFGLADQLDVSWTDLASLNGWTEETILQIGDQFLVPNLLSDYPANVAAKMMTDDSVLNELSTDVYFIRAGDTLISIAQDFESDWQVLAHINNLHNAELLQIGQRLLVPARPGANETVLQENPERLPSSHFVEAGDTIISIATQYGIEWQSLLRMNGLTESSILQIGQEVLISTSAN